MGHHHGAKFVILALSVAFMWGLQPVVHRQLLDHLDPATVLTVGGTFYFTALLMFNQ